MALGMSAEPETGKNRSLLMAAIAMTFLSMTLWWVNTVIAMLFLFASMFIIVYTLCSVPIEQPPLRPKRRKWEGMSIERIDLLEKRMRESLEEIVMMEEEEVEEDSYSIPVDEFEGPSSGLEHDIPVEIIDGIGKAYGMRLREIGIKNLEELALSSPERIQEACGISLQEAGRWIADAIGIFMGAGMTSVLELAMSDAEEIIKRIEDAIERGKIRVPEGHEFTIWSARQWIKAADEHIILSPEDIRRWAEDNR